MDIYVFEFRLFGILFLFICYKLDSKNAQSEFAVKKPKPYCLKPKPQKLPQNRTAKKPQYAVLHFQKPQFAVLLSVLA